MLTLDDLDHFSDAGFAHLFAPPTRRTDVDALARLERILACLNFCNGTPTEELVEGGVARARFHVRNTLRRLRRNPRLDREEAIASLVSALAAFGEVGMDADLADDVLDERMAMECEIESAAAPLDEEGAGDPGMLASLARGEFQILPSSDFSPLSAGAGRYGEKVRIDVDLSLDMETGAAHFARVLLVLESGFWRWTAGDGCCMSRNGDTALRLSPDDAVVQALLAGLTRNSCRSALAYAEATEELRAQFA
jgi:hypothetical protein